MADMFEQGIDLLTQQRHRHLTRPVEYVRSGESVVLNATVGRTEFEQVDEYNVVHRLESRDFLVRAEDLVLVGEQTLPQVGDHIRETAGDTVFVFEVIAQDNHPPYRYSDPLRKTLRIHTRQVAREEA